MQRDADRVLPAALEFVRAIGLELREEPLPSPTFLPGLTIRAGALVLDRTRLAHPGDVLHEAGHLATTPPALRASLDGVLHVGPPEEMMAIGWSYAAALHLGLEPGAVFHPGGYGGRAAALLQSFALGVPVGLPLLEAAGLTLGPRTAAAHGAPPYPHMLAWLRAS
jgi:hypothetical protein